MQPTEDEKEESLEDSEELDDIEDLDLDDDLVEVDDLVEPDDELVEVDGPEEADDGLEEGDDLEENDDLLEDDDLVELEAEEPVAAPLRYQELAANAPFRSSRVLLLVAAFALGQALYLAIEPTEAWILLVVTAVVAIGADGVLRDLPEAVRTEDIAWTAPLLFLPTLLTLSAGLFLEDTVDGYLILPGVAAVSALLAAILFAQQASVNPLTAYYPTARLILNFGTYLTAFGFYAVVYTFDVSLVPAALTVGMVSTLLSVEILREAEADPFRALVFAGVVGLVVAEARWALYFLPVESYLAAAFLLLVFYLVSGLVQHHLDNDLRAPIVIEFIGIALLGVVIVTLGRILEAGAV